jgi:uncharacterized flavoprotein (TIGR03862 family)
MTADRDAQVAVIGGGPAGLMAAETLARAGLAVTVYERMPSVGRKLLMAGRGGLNLTHSEPLPAFLARYGAAAGRLAPLLRAFPPAALVAWAEGLGQPTFTGSSGRVFPRAMKASPLLRAWLARLAGLGVRILLRHEWRGWDDAGRLLFEHAGRGFAVPADATVLALGGASWPRLGATGAWAGLLSARGVPLAPFRPSNCGFSVSWSSHFRGLYAGLPLKNVALTAAGNTARGDATVTAYGLEGGAVYALGPAPREAIARAGAVTLHVDLRPDLDLEAVAARLARRGKAESLAKLLRRTLRLSPVAANLLREARPSPPADPRALAALVKDVPVLLTGTQPLERAISTAGGVALEALDERLMLRALPGVFAAGEMLDWEAPTGGYLLQACFASGAAAGAGAAAWLSERR